MMHVPKQFVVDHPLLGRGVGNNGYFQFPSTISGRTLGVIASDGMGWEHASVCVYEGKKERTPTWAEMCQVKDLFWDEEDCVIQYHPPKSEYINNHENILHLWKKVGTQFETPPTMLVGIKE